MTNERLSQRRESKFSAGHGCSRLPFAPLSQQERSLVNRRQQRERRVARPIGSSRANFVTFVRFCKALPTFCRLKLGLAQNPPHETPVPSARESWSFDAAAKGCSSLSVL